LFILWENGSSFISPFEVFFEQSVANWVESTIRSWKFHPHWMQGFRGGSNSRTHNEFSASRWTTYTVQPHRHWSFWICIYCRQSIVSYWWEPWHSSLHNRTTISSIRIKIRVYWRDPRLLGMQEFERGISFTLNIISLHIYRFSFIVFICTGNLSR
jgi:hypothetical protein